MNVWFCELSSCSGEIHERAVNDTQRKTSEAITTGLQRQTMLDDGVSVAAVWLPVAQPPACYFVDNSPFMQPSACLEYREERKEACAQI